MTGDRSRHLPDRLVAAPDERRQVILDSIRSARSRLTLSLFRCNEPEIFRELAAAVDRGVDVQVLMTSRAKGGRKKLRRLWDNLEATGVSVHAYNDPVVKYHAKYLIVDEGPAAIASFNFTRKCFTSTFDGMLITHDRAVVEGLRALMEADRRGVPVPASLPERLIVGPENARRQFTTFIEQATSSILIIDPKLSDPAILSLLTAKRAQGLRVEVFGDRYLAGLKSHGKMMLIDNARGVLGSLALTALGLDFRREVAVSFDEPEAVARLSDLFEVARGTVPSPWPVGSDWRDPAC